MLNLFIQLHQKFKYVLCVLSVSFELMHFLEVIFVRFEAQNLQNAILTLVQDG
jgi:hypothetical protein